MPPVCPRVAHACCVLALAHRVEQGACRRRAPGVVAPGRLALALLRARRWQATDAGIGLLIVHSISPAGWLPAGVPANPREWGDVTEREGFALPFFWFACATGLA